LLPGAVLGLRAGARRPGRRAPGQLPARAHLALAAARPAPPRPLGPALLLPRAQRRRLLRRPAVGRPLLLALAGARPAARDDVSPLLPPARLAQLLVLLPFPDPLSPLSPGRRGPRRLPVRLRQPAPGPGVSPPAARPLLHGAVPVRRLPAARR